jgi:hypothetical protein
MFLSDKIKERNVNPNNSIKANKKRQVQLNKNQFASWRGGSYNVIKVSCLHHLQ